MIPPLASCSSIRWHLRGLLMAAALPTFAQAQLNTPVLVQPSIDPVGAGTVDTLLRLADGRILVGSAVIGGFERLGAVSADSCGRLLADGSPDPSFACAPSAVVEFAQDSQGRVYQRGNFSVSRLLANGATDPSFPAVNTDQSITALMIVDDFIYLGGVFATVNSQPRARIARLHLDGTLDPAFTPSADAAVFSMIAPGDGFVYVGGAFGMLGGEVRTGIGRIALGSGSVDAWNVVLTRSGGNPSVSAMGLDSTHLFIGGSFASVQGAPRQNLARIGRSAAATLDGAWTAGMSSGSGSGPTMLSVVGEHVYLSAGFTGLTVQNGATSTGNRCFLRVGRVSAEVDTIFDPFGPPVPGTLCSVQEVIPGDGGGRLFVGGTFQQLAGSSARFGLVALNPDGSVDGLSALPDALTLATVQSVAVDPANASLYVQGDFRRVNGVTRQGLIRMLSNGTIDSGFRPPARRYTAMALVDNQLFVADDSTRTLQRLDPLTGDPVVAFAPIPYNLSVSSLQATPTHLYLFGNYNLTGVTPPLGRFARVTLASGSIDTNFRFTPDASTSILGVAADATSNSLFIHGTFNSLNGTGPARLARLDAASLAIDAGFNANVPNSVSRALIDDAGGIFISGGFTTVGGQACRAPARLVLATGVRDTSFACSANQGGSVMALAADAVFIATTTQIRRYARAAGGALDPNWRVSDLPQFIAGMLASSRELYVHGRYDHISGAIRRSLAALPQVEQFQRNGFE